MAGCRVSVADSGRRDAARLDAEGRNKSPAASKLKTIYWREASGFTRLSQSTAAVSLFTPSKGSAGSDLVGSRRAFGWGSDLCQTTLGSVDLSDCIADNAQVLARKFVGAVFYFFLSKGFLSMHLISKFKNMLGLQLAH